MRNWKSGPKSITHSQSQWTRTTDVISAVEYVLGWVLTFTSLGNIGVKLSFQRSIENTCAYKYYDWLRRHKVDYRNFLLILESSGNKRILSVFHKRTKYNWLCSQKWLWIKQWLLQNIDVHEVSQRSYFVSYCINIDRYEDGRFYVKAIFFIN